MRRRAAIAIALLAVVLAAAPARAADLVVLAAAAVKGSVTDIPARFAATTGGTVRFVFGTAGGLHDQAVAGTPFDVIILPPAPLADLVKRDLVVAGSRADLGVVRLGAAVAAGAPRPYIGSPDAFAKALLAAPSIGLADPATGATSGIYLVKLLSDLGIAEQVRAKLKVYPEGQVAMAALARHEVALALGQMSEITPVPGVDPVGPLPEALQLKTIYAAGLASRSMAPQAAGVLLGLLGDTQTQAAFRRQGFDEP